MQFTYLDNQKKKITTRQHAYYVLVAKYVFYTTMIKCCGKLVLLLSSLFNYFKFKLLFFRSAYLHLFSEEFFFVFLYFVGCLSIDFRCVETHFFCSIHLNMFYSPSSAWGNLGNVLKNQGKVAEAEQAYRNALYYRRNMADMLYNL